MVSSEIRDPGHEGSEPTGSGRSAASAAAVNAVVRLVGSEHLSSNRELVAQVARLGKFPKMDWAATAGLMQPQVNLNQAVLAASEAVRVLGTVPSTYSIPQVLLESVRESNRTLLAGMAQLVKSPLMDLAQPIRRMQSVASSETVLAAISVAVKPALDAFVRSQASVLTSLEHSVRQPLAAFMPTAISLYLALDANMAMAADVTRRTSTSGMTLPTELLESLGALNNARIDDLATTAGLPRVDLLLPSTVIDALASSTDALLSDLAAKVKPVLGAYAQSHAVESRDLVETLWASPLPQLFDDATPVPIALPEATTLVVPSMFEYSGTARATQTGLLADEDGGKALVLSAAGLLVSILFGVLGVAGALYPEVTRNAIALLVMVLLR